MFLSRPVVSPERVFFSGSNPGHGYRTQIGTTKIPASDVVFSRDLVQYRIGRRNYDKRPELVLLFGTSHERTFVQYQYSFTIVHKLRLNLIWNTRTLMIMYFTSAPEVVISRKLCPREFAHWDSIVTL